MEKKTGSFVSRFIGGMVSLSSFGLVSMVVGLLTTMIIVRRFSTETYGSYVLLYVIVSFLGLVSSLGLDLSIARFIAAAQDEERKRDLVNTAILLRLLAIATASLVAWIIRPLLLQLFSASTVTDLMIFVLLLFLLESTRSTLKAILQGFFRFTQIGISDVIVNPINLLLLLTVTPFLNSGVLGLISARAIAVFISAIFAYFSIPIKKKIVLRIDIIRELVKFGYPLQINDILFFISSRADTLIVASLMGPTGVAFYEIARKIPDNLRQLYEPFRSVYYAFSSKLFAQGDRNKYSKLLNDSARLIGFVTITGAGIVLLFGKDIIQIMFSSKYLTSYPIFVLLMVNLSISLVGNILGTSLVTAGESDKPAIINIFNSVGSLVSCMILIPIWGTIGAAIGNMLGTITVYPPSIVFLRKKYDLRIVPYLKSTVIFLVWTIIVLLLSPTSFFAKLGFLALYLFVSFLFSIVTKNDMTVFLQESGITSWGPLQRLFPSRNHLK